MYVYGVYFMIHWDCNVRGFIITSSYSIMVFDVARNMKILLLQEIILIVYIQPDQWEEYYQQKYCTKPPGESSSNSILRCITTAWIMYLCTFVIWLAVLVTGGCPRDRSSPLKHWQSPNLSEDELKIPRSLVSNKSYYTGKMGSCIMTS